MQVIDDVCDEGDEYEEDENDEKYDNVALHFEVGFGDLAFRGEELVDKGLRLSESSSMRSCRALLTVLLLYCGCGGWECTVTRGDVYAVRCWFQSMVFDAMMCA